MSARHGSCVAPVNISHPVEQAFHNALLKKMKRRGTEVKGEQKEELCNCDLRRPQAACVQTIPGWRNLL